ncbi:MAG TPA: hypothetical protein VEW48_19430 [Thermoanaerobaculia bacterium]|nr:hypothetical protein [Thermoanaerobaculia bacterium]
MAQVDASDGWSLEGIPKQFWPHVRDILVARDLYKFSTLVSDKRVAQTLAQTAEGLLAHGARSIAEAKATAK